MQVLTMGYSNDVESKGIIDIGLKSLGCDGLLTFGTDVIMAVFHCCGMLPSANV